METETTPIRDLVDFEDRLHRKARAVEAARASLIERARSVVAGHRIGPEEIDLAPLLDGLAVALEEYDRVRTTEPGSER